MTRPVDTAAGQAQAGRPLPPGIAGHPSDVAATIIDTRVLNRGR